MESKNKEAAAKILLEAGWSLEDIICVLFDSSRWIQYVPYLVYPVLPNFQYVPYPVYPVLPNRGWPGITWAVTNVTNPDTTQGIIT